MWQTKWGLKGNWATKRTPRLSSSSTKGKEDSKWSGRTRLYIMLRITDSVEGEAIWNFKVYLINTKIA